MEERKARARGLWISGAALCAVLLAAAAVLIPWPGLSSGYQSAESSEASRTFLVDCGQSAVQEPASFTLACADAGRTLDAMTWSEWGGSTARATGILRENTCNPSCAEGKMEEHAVRVVAGGRHQAGSTFIYRTLTVSYQDGSPSSGKNTQETFDVTLGGDAG